MRDNNFRMVSRGTRAFTLVELLVVIAIIGLLAGMMIPAVQSSRETARRMECGNNLKQLGLGFQNFASARGSFPPRRWSRAVDGGYSGWGTFLLPFIGQQGLYNAYNWKYDFYDPVNKAVVETKISTFICPSTRRNSDIICSGPATAGSANSNKTATYTVTGCIDYCAPNGFQAPTTGWGTSVPAMPDGNNAHQAMVDDTNYAGFANKWPRRLKEIKDGLSKTLLINETAGWPHQFKGRQHQQLADHSLGNRGSWAGWQTYVYYTYSADGSLNSASNPTAGDLVDCGINAYNKMQVFSFHPRGAYVLFCDGSARFVGEDISPLAFAQIVLCDDGQTITDENIQ